MEIVMVRHEISNECISDLLATALEGGSNYWLNIGGRDTRKKPENFANTKAGDEIYTHISYPMNEGGEITLIEIENNKKRILNLSAIRRGLKRMARSKTFAFRFQNIIKDDYDVVDADVFLQFAVLGEVAYG